MSSFINKLRQKPADVKNRIALIVAGSITILLVLIWMLVLKNQNQNDDIKKRSVGEDLRPLMMIFGGAKDDFSQMRENIRNSE